MAEGTNKINNIHPVFDRILERSVKEKLLNQKAKVIWLTGLSGSGKSTIAINLEKRLHAEGIYTMLLDGDNVRSGLCSNLGFSLEDRQENIRRIGEVAKLFCENGTVVICSFVSPTQSSRAMARGIIGKENFVGVFVKTSLEECERRDVKGLYQKARKGEIKNFTGIDSPYEEPTDEYIQIETVNKTVQESTDALFQFIKDKIVL